MGGGPLGSNKEERWRRRSSRTIGIDVDAVAGWLGSYGGEDSPCDITRGLFAGEIGSPRLLKMFGKYWPPHHLVHSRPLDRDLPRQMQMVAMPDTRSVSMGTPTRTRSP